MEWNGMEWGVLTNATDGHVVIYGFGNQLIGWDAGNYDIYVAKSDYDALFKKVKNNPNAFCYLAHPDPNHFNNLASNPYNATYDSAIVGVPFRSGPAFSTCKTYTDYPTNDYLWYYKTLLSKGYKIGCGYDHDSHYTNFGRNDGGRLVILAPSLTTNNLFSAMKNMHFYGSDDWNAAIDFKINGSEIMGNIASAPANPTITISHNDGDGEVADSIKIWAGYAGSNTLPTVIHIALNTNVLSYIDNNINLNAQKYYFIEIVQQDGERIITSPIWYTKILPTDIHQLDNALNVILYPNPIQGVLYISNVEKDYDVVISDVTGKQLISQHINENNANIDMNHISQGVYLIYIYKNENLVYTNKLIKN